MKFAKRQSLLPLLILAAVALAAIAAAPLARKENAASGGRPRFAATIQPLAAILRELARDRAEIVRLAPPGASPHTYEPRPSDVRAAQGAAALFYVGASLDGWAARLPAKKKIEVFPLLPESYRLSYSEDPFGEHEGAAHVSEHDHEHAHEHDAGLPDAHFWSDPLAVKALLPGLARELGSLDPEGKLEYEANARAFAERLDALDKELAAALAPVRGRAVILFHPSLQYFLKRYGLQLAGTIEPFPGKEPPPRYLAGVKERLGKAGARAVFTEPQLPPRPAEIVAEAAGVKLFELDPYGGARGDDDYATPLRLNAEVLLKALR